VSLILENGAIDMIVDRRELREKIASILSMLTHSEMKPIAEESVSEDIPVADVIEDGQ